MGDKIVREAIWFSFRTATGDAFAAAFAENVIGSVYEFASVSSPGVPWRWHFHVGAHENVANGRASSELAAKRAVGQAAKRYLEKRNANSNSKRSG